MDKESDGGESTAAGAHEAGEQWHRALFYCHACTEMAGPG